jgi:hypothetical protein
MANLTLAPEEDDPLFSLGLNSGISTRKCVDEPKLPTELQRLRGQFDPQKVGFGLIAPWPGTDQAIKFSDRNGAPSSGNDRKGDPREGQK